MLQSVEDSLNFISVPTINLICNIRNAIPPKIKPVFVCTIKQKSRMLLSIRRLSSIVLRDLATINMHFVEFCIILSQYLLVQTFDFES